MGLSMTMYSTSVTGMDTATSKRILLVEDDAVFLAEARQVLAQHPDFDVVAQAQSLVETRRCLGLNKRCAAHGLSIDIDIAVIDVGLPDGSGIDLIGQLKRCRPQIKCLIMTVFEDRETAQAALQAGADGYVVKSAPDFVLQLEQLSAQQHPWDPRVTGHLLARLRPPLDAPQAPDLSPRERQTLQALAEGQTYNDISVTLGVSVHTVADYIKGLYRKLSVNSRSEAVYQGLLLGIISMQERSGLS